jgi:hypothetical protein
MLTMRPYFRTADFSGTPTLTPFALSDATVETSIIFGFANGFSMRTFLQSPALSFASGSALSFFEGGPTVDLPNGMLSYSGADMTAYLYNADTGDRVWSVSFQSESKTWGMEPASFPPMLFWNAAPYVAIISLGNRHFAVVEMNQGLQIADAFLPMCKGYSWTAFSEFEKFGTARDDTNNVLYVTLGNPCLYGIRATTGAVFAVQNSRSGAIVGSPLVTPTCVVTIDFFGTVSCFPRLTSPFAKQQPESWKYSTGYNYDHENDQISLYGEFLIVAIGPNLLCLSVNQSGQLFWTVQIGSSARFVAFNGYVYAVSSYAVVKVSMDPTLEMSQRIVWQVPHAVLSGGLVDYGGLRATPLVTANGVLVFSSGLRLLGLNCTSKGYGQLVFNMSLPERASALAQFTGPAAASDPVLRNVFFSSAEHHRLHDANTGDVLITYSPFYATKFPSQPLLLNAAAKSIAYFSSDFIMFTALPVAYLQTKLARDPMPEPLVPAPNATLPAGFTPQGRFAGIPTVPPGVKLPDYGCVLNVEALYTDFVSCVNSAITVIYVQNPNWSSVDCAAAADVMNACVMQWTGGTDGSCLGATLYLNQVLGQLNASSAFNFCEQPQRCSDPSAAPQVCDVVNTAARLAPGQTLYPAFTFPAPADELPVFTLPPSPPTTLAPTTTSVPSLAPGSTHAPPTASPPVVTTPSPQVPTTTAAFPTQQPASTGTASPTAVPGVFQYLCSVVPGTPAPPKALAVNLQALLGLPTLPSITTTLMAGIRGKAASNTFVFYFTDIDQAPALCALLNAKLDSSPGLVAQQLQLVSIDRQPFTPSTPSPQAASGPDGSVVGVVFGSVAAASVVVVAMWFIIRSRRSKTGLNQSDLLEAGGLQGGPSTTTRESRGGEEMAPILASKEKPAERGGYTQL